MHGTEKDTRTRGRRGRRHMRGGRGHGPRGHRARRGDVRSAILALLDERQMHGYEMIQELEERTGGRWRPSAGSIYPTLQLLEDEGLVKAEEVEGKRVFALTDAGRERLAERGQSKPPWQEDEPRSERHKLGREIRGVADAAAQVLRAGDEAEAAEAAEMLAETRKRLYALLSRD